MIENTMDNQIVSLTPKAVEQVKRIFITENAKPDQGLRLGVVGGGCSGFSYKIEISDFKEKDNIIKYDDIKVFVDPKSSIYLKGIVLDYQDGLNGKGFVFDNPNAKNTCGCGESFTI